MAATQQFNDLFSVPAPKTSAIAGDKLFELFTPHERLLQDRVAGELCSLFEEKFRRIKLQQAKEGGSNTISFLPQIEKRSLDELAVSGDLFKLKNSAKKSNKNIDLSVELDTELFAQSYFVQRPIIDEQKFKQAKKQKAVGENGEVAEDDEDSDEEESMPLLNYVIELDKEKLKHTNPILEDSDKFLQEQSVLNGIENKLLAPHIDKTMEKKYSGEWARDVKEKLRTAGKGWYNMEEVVLTPELKQELAALKLMHAASGSGRAPNLDEEDVLQDDDDTDDLYDFELTDKKNSLQVSAATGSNVAKAKQKAPKFFQVGTVIEGPHEYYSNRTRKRDRKGTLLDQIIHEQSSTGYVNDRYKQLQKNLDSVQLKKKRRLMHVKQKVKNASQNK